MPAASLQYSGHALRVRGQSTAAGGLPRSLPPSPACSSEPSWIWAEHESVLCHEAVSVMCHSVIMLQTYGPIVLISALFQAKIIWHYIIKIDTERLFIEMKFCYCCERAGKVRGMRVPYGIVEGWISR